jgi:hypothetical protein
MAKAKLDKATRKLIQDGITFREEMRRLTLETRKDLREIAKIQRETEAMIRRGVRQPRQR